MGIFDKLQTGFVFAVFLFAGSICSQSVTVGAGSFIMGDNKGESDEMPEHQVSISAFRMDSHEVTEAQYDSCVKSGKCTPAHYSDGKCGAWTNNGFKNVYVPADRRDPHFPVVCITWFQAKNYCQAYGKTLPSEAQWEYAATAGQKIRYSWGNFAPSSSTCAAATNHKPTKTCSKSVNAAGLYDMTGNVWEWTNDFYSPDYYSYSETENPRGPPVGLYRVIRGGGWYSGEALLRIQNRNWFSPDFSEVSLGFRCVSQ